VNFVLEHVAEENDPGGKEEQTAQGLKDRGDEPSLHTGQKCERH